MKIKELPMDQKTTITLLLTSIEEKETRNSSPYCTLTLTDGIDTIIAQLWNTKKENVKVQEKTLISAEIYKKMYNDYEKLLDYLTERTYAGDGLQETNLTGLKFTLKGVDYEVLEHTKDKYRVLMLNRKAISK